MYRVCDDGILCDSICTMHGRLGGDEWKRQSARGILQRVLGETEMGRGVEVE